MIFMKVVDKSSSVTDVGYLSDVDPTAQSTSFWPVQVSAGWMFWPH